MNNQDLTYLPKYKACKICGRLATEPFITLSEYEGVVMCDDCKIIRIVDKCEIGQIPLINEINKIFNEERDASKKHERVVMIEKLRHRVLDAVRAECYMQFDK